MHVVEAPSSVVAKPVGSVVLEPTAQALRVFIKEDPASLDSYPRPCSLGLRLPSWEMPPVLAVALLVSVARQDRLTFQTWIDAGTLQGMQVLNCLARDPRIYVHLVTNSVERTIRTVNIVKRHAAGLLRQLSTRRQKWSEEQFANARRQLDTLYPTAPKLWRACQRDGKG